MIASQFNLDQRLAELRPSEAELRQARERRDAALSSEDSRSGRTERFARPNRVRFGGVPTRVAVG